MKKPPFLLVQQSQGLYVGGFSEFACRQVRETPAFCDPSDAVYEKDASMSLYWPPFPFPATLPFGRSCLAICWTSKVLQKTASQSKPRLCSASLSPCALKNVAIIGIRCQSVTQRPQSTS